MATDKIRIVSVRMPETLYKRVCAKARREQRTPSSFMRYALTQAVRNGENHG